MKKGICLFFGFLFCFMSIIGCSDNSNHGSGRAYAAPPVMPAAKPPAAFSNDGEFLGYVIGGGGSIQQIEIYNDEINFRFVVSNNTGDISLYGSLNVYSPDSSCQNLYHVQYKLQDAILGKTGNEADGWPYDDSLTYVTTDSTKELTYDKMLYRKQWGTLRYGNGQVITEPCIVNGQQASCTVSGWLCNSIDDAYRQKYLSMYKFHQVVGVDPALIPFQIPIALPIDIRVIY